MAKLILHRNSSWITANGKFRLYLNEEKIGNIKNNLPSSFEVKPGEHKLKVIMSVWGSKEFVFTVDANSTKNIQISESPFTSWSTKLALGLLLLMSIINFWVGFSSTLFWGFAIAFMAYLVFLFTYGRFNYFNLKVMDSE